MRTSSRRARLFAGAVGASLLAGAAGLLATAQPAFAQVTFESAPRLSWSYTDSENKDTAFAIGGTNVPVGTWLDGTGQRHKSRTYATFDLTGYAGKTIVSTKLFLRDDKSANCDLRVLELWETTVPAEPPTWRTAPTEIALLGTLGSAACPGATGIDLTDRVRAATAAGQTRLAIEIRVSDTTDPGEGDPRTARSLSWFYGLRLTVGYNTPPSVVSQHLYNNGRPCDTEAPYPYLGDDSFDAGSVQLGAMVTDPDPNTAASLTGEFAVWPLTDPEQRTLITRAGASPGWVTNVNVPDGVLTEGSSYGWAARVTDGTDTSDWSQTCSFTFDSIRPAAAPGVVSENYPENRLVTGGPAPTFTFTPNGVDDVAGYQYAFDLLGVHGYSMGEYGVPMWTDPFDSPGFVRADGPGASATVTVAFPRGGPLRLLVRSFDRAYHSSPIREYRFFVTDTAPTITVSGEPSVGQPLTLNFAKHGHVTDVVEYTYQVDDEAAQTVAATPDGSATITATLTGYGWHTVSARSRSSNGFVSSEGAWSVSIDNMPSVTSATYPENATGGGVGVAGSFTFHPGSGGAASYVYSFNYGEEHTVQASDDGTATISYTPEYGGFTTLIVRAIDSNGQASGDYYYYFEVAEAPLPIVTSQAYPEWASGGGVGIAGTFNFQPGPANTASYVYAFNWGAEASVPAGSDGSATVPFTPEYSGFNQLAVYAVDGNGTQISSPTFYYFIVAESPS